MKRQLIFILILGILLFKPAFGQEKPLIYFKAPAENLAPGSEFTIDVILDSQSAINVVDLVINYSNLEFLSFNNANSIIDIWQNSSKGSDGVIYLRGGMTKPFNGQSGQIMKLNFRSSKSGQAELSFKKTDFYLADGLGTKIQSSAPSLTLSVIPGAPLLTLASSIKEDKIPPTLKVKIASNPAEKSKLVIFTSNDNESGVKQTYFRERQWLLWNQWQTVNNPVRLEANAWMFQLKSVDNQNNSAEQTVYVKEVIIKRLIELILLAIAALAAFYFLKILRTTKKRKRCYN